VNSFRILLLPFSFFYWLAITVRNRLFDIGLLRVTQVHVPVLSVGNISAGGTGKTPFVELLVRKLQASGHKPAVLSRGYGRRTHGFLFVSRGEGQNVASVMDGGDEPVQLAGSLKDVVVAVGENRVNAAERILVESSADCIVLDDGFQHRYLHRDLDIVLVTARELVEKQWLLPAGYRRESVASLQRADALVISKCKDVRECAMARAQVPAGMLDRVATFQLSPTALRNVSTGKCIDRSERSKIPVVIFSGLGDPKSFRQSVEDFGCLVVKSVEFPDHHWYSANDLAGLRKEFADRKAELLITTEKDWMKLRSLEGQSEVFSKEVSLHVMEVVPVFIEGEEVIDRLIEKVMQ
jgi:tetraacyldisaccharide 4'-kinase